MKKRIQLLFLFLILIPVLCGCSLLYSADWLESDDLWLSPHMIRKVCFVGRYTWSGDGPEAVLRVPDVCEGYSVTGLGGFHGSGAPTPFGIYIPGTKAMHGEGTLPENAKIEQYHLTIHLGKKIKETKLIDMNCYHNMGGNRFIQVLVTVTCDEENPYFYSENGKLYSRKNDSLVPGFFYYYDYQKSMT